MDTVPYGQYGSSESIGAVSVDGTETTVEFAFENGTESASLVVADGGVTGLSFAQAYEVPAYVDERRLFVFESVRTVAAAVSVC